MPLDNIRETELFWNQIMMEHALFIRGLLDPTECELLETADMFAGITAGCWRKQRSGMQEPGMA